jgi:hypothetical protein
VAQDIGNLSANVASFHPTKGIRSFYFYYQRAPLSTALVDVAHLGAIPHSPPTSCLDVPLYLRP